MEVEGGGGYIQRSRILVDKDLCLLLVDKHSQYLTIKIQEVRGGGKGLQEVWGFRRYGEGVEGMGLQEVGRGVEGMGLQEVKGGYLSIYLSIYFSNYLSI